MLLQDKEANSVKCNTNIKVAEHNHYSRLMVSAESLLDSLCSNVLSSGSGWGCLMWVLGPPSNYCSFHCRFSQNLFEHNQFWHEWWKPVMTMFRANRNCVTNLPLKGRMKGWRVWPMMFTKPALLTLHTDCPRVLISWSLATSDLSRCCQGQSKHPCELIIRARVRAACEHQQISLLMEILIEDMI